MRFRVLLAYINDIYNKKNNRLSLDPEAVIYSQLTGKQPSSVLSVIIIA